MQRNISVQARRVISAEVTADALPLYVGENVEQPALEAR
jgi:hypothetical protein